MDATTLNVFETNTSFMDQGLSRSTYVSIYPFSAMHSLCCELTQTRDVTQEGKPNLAGKHTSRVHICET